MDELTTLYHRLIFQVHPDKGPPEQRGLRNILSQQINQAYKDKNLELLRRLSVEVQSLAPDEPLHAPPPPKPPKQEPKPPSPPSPPTPTATEEMIVRRQEREAAAQRQRDEATRRENEMFRAAMREAEKRVAEELEAAKQYEMDKRRAEAKRQAELQKQAEAKRQAELSEQRKKEQEAAKAAFEQEQERLAAAKILEEWEASRKPGNRDHYNSLPFQGDEYLKMVPRDPAAEERKERERQRQQHGRFGWKDIAKKVHGDE